MVDVGHHPALPLESPTKALVLRQFGGDHLERNATVEVNVLGEVDDAHAASSDLFKDPITSELAGTLLEVRNVGRQLGSLSDAGGETWVGAVICGARCRRGRGHAAPAGDPSQW